MTEEKKTKSQDAGRSTAAEPDRGSGQNSSGAAGASEDRKLKIERDVEGIFSKFSSEPDSRKKPPQIVEDPIGIKIELVDDQEIRPDKVVADKKTAAGNGRRKPSRRMFAIAGFLAVLTAATAFFILKTGERRPPTDSPKPLTTQKINRPSPRPPAKIPQAETTVKLKPTVSQDDEVKTFLARWKTAWENTAGKQGDMDTYMSFYAENFVSKGMNKSEWRRDKTKKNRIKDWIRLELKDVHIDRPAAGDQIEVRFLLVYNSSNYADKTRKVLGLQKEGSVWKITTIKTME